MNLDKYKYINNINSPEELRKYKNFDLLNICKEIRDYIIECCSQNPGHLGASIGAVELIVAIHYIFNTPKDKVIFDVGHQAYAHKILTGRRELFKKNRKKDGISGFPNRFESKYDAFGTGHSSTSISAALGMAKAYQILGEDKQVIALIGDGAMTGGLAMEALNNAGDTNVLIILNDNNQSIDSNTGAVHNYLLKITTAPTYNKIKSHIWNSIGEGKMRETIQKWTLDAKSSLVRSTGGALFEALGLRYFGPIDGNDINLLVDVLSKLKDIKGPKLLHVKTIKGKGLSYAETNPIIWHAPGKFDPKTGERFTTNYSTDRYQDVFGEVLTELAKENKKIVGITPAMCTGCGMNKFAELFPERYFDVGIEEEHSVTFSAGLAATGIKPFCNIYSSFSQRAYDQIIHDVALQKLPVVFCFDRGGLVGEDGATHQGCFDMAAYRSIPNMIISAPRNEIELKHLMYTGSILDYSPMIIRYPRGLGEGVNWKDTPWKKIEIGKGEQLKDGKHIAIIGLGPCINRAVEACDVFKKEFGFSPAVFDLKFIKPIDIQLLMTIFNKFKSILTIEEGCIKGGLFGEIAELAAINNYTGKVEGIGIPDRFINHDKQEYQRRDCGLDKAGILEKLRILKDF